MHAMTDEQFDAIVEEALDDVPGELMAMLDNVAFFVEAEPPPEDPDLLGHLRGHAAHRTRASGGARDPFPTASPCTGDR